MKSGWRRLPGRRTWTTALIAACLVGAFLEPSLVLRRPTYDYIIALDVTQSMNTRDVVLDGVRMSRIHYAKRLLEGDYRSMQEISDAVGYQDVAYFRQLFQRHTGVSPSAYRRSFGV